MGRSVGSSWGRGLNMDPDLFWHEERFQMPGGGELFCRFYDPPGAKQTVVILHGYGEHSGRYVKFSEKLGPRPVRLAVMDYRGMGISRTLTKDAADFEDYLEDVSLFMMHLRNVHSIKNEVVLLGHSLGGLIAIEWVRRNPKAVKRLVLSAPFIGFPNLCFLKNFNRCVSFFFPAYIYRNPVIPKKLSHDSGECRAYRADPLIRREISARLIGSIFDRIVTLQRLESVVLSCAVNILAAGEDRIVDPRAARRFFERLVAPSKDYVRFDGFYHEIFNEVAQDKAFNVLKTILEDCV